MEEKRQPRSLWRALKRILPYARPYRIRLITGLLVTILAMTVWLTIPLGLRALIDAVFLAKTVSPAQFK